MKFSLFIVMTCLPFLGMAVVAADSHKETAQVFKWGDIPVIQLKRNRSDISNYKYLGSWLLDPGSNWRNTWDESVRLDLEYEKRTVRLSTQVKPAPESIPRHLTPEAEGEYFKTMTWQGYQVSAFAFNAISERPQTAVLEFDADTRFAVYNNGKLIKEVLPDDTVETGALQFLPVALENRDNVFFILILSNNRPPRIRTSIVRDQSRDFQAAWNADSSFLNKNIFPSVNSLGPPMLKWNPLLRRLLVSIEVRDCLTGNMVLAKNNLRNDNVIRDGASNLKEGLYNISYKSNQSQASEYFIIGSPRKAFQDLKKLLLAHDWNEKALLNLEAQIKRGEFFLDPQNYDPDNREWQARVVYTLGALVDFVKFMKEGSENPFRDTPGLHIRGFVSEIDQTKQFYRLFVPSTYDPNQGAPLLLIMPTPIASQSKPFIVGPVMASLQKALQICNYAEKYGFAVLWPGYKNPPDGWPYETAHIDEVIKAVEKDYNINHEMISLYGICVGGFFAGRLAADYPNRFAAIVYDRAFFDRNVQSMLNASESLKYWHKAIDPAQRIINNTNIKIFVINDGSSTEGHGEIWLSEKFLETATKTRADIKYALGQRPIGLELWDMIFPWLATCRNAAYDENRTNDLSSYGFNGPISMAFSKPFLVVVGTSADSDGQAFIHGYMESLKVLHGKQFFGESLRIKEDTDVTESDLKTHSLFLVGNPESNKIWSRLEEKFPVRLSPDGVSIEGQSYSPVPAFLAVSRNPFNTENYIILAGARELRHLKLVKTTNPFKAWYDYCLFKPHGEFHKQHIINASLKNTQNLKMP
jgi:pimeloyl-ACP methyl ester carboxylesterase